MVLVSGFQDMKIRVEILKQKGKMPDVLESPGFIKGNLDFNFNFSAAILHIFGYLC
jgi:hypothetical protein